MSKIIPVNAPTSQSARLAVADLLRRESRPFVVVSAEPIEQQPDEHVAITVTKPVGPRLTFGVEIERTDPLTDEVEAERASRIESLACDR